MSLTTLVGPLSIVLLAMLFLLLLVVLGSMSLGLARTFGGSRAGSEARGTSCLGGCLTAAALGFLILLGLAGGAGFLALAAAALATSVVQRVEVNLPEEHAGTGLGEPGFELEEQRLRVAFEVRGHLGTELGDLVRRLTHGDVELDVTRGEDERGAYSIYEFVLPPDPRALRDLERDLERELRKLHLPHGSVQLRRSHEL